MQDSSEAYPFFPKAPQRFRLKLSVVFAIGALLAAGTTWAQTAANDQTDQTTNAATSEASLGEVVVTGSRIPVPANITATSPTTTVSIQQIQEEGQTDTIDVINQLPQNIINAAVDFGNNSNPLNAPGGIATADLRGLGPQRTLVLVDGVRLGDGDPNTGNPNPAPDLDQIPAALIERVDVVTGGASAVYGSDAMAGVINFILKKNFQGIEIDGQYGFLQHDNDETGLQAGEDAVGATNSGFTAPSGSIIDGDKRDLSIIAGTNTQDGNGNVTGYFTIHNQEPVPGSHRDFADCELLDPVEAGTGPGANSLGCYGSENSNQFLVGTTPYSVVGSSLLPWPQPGSSPPSYFNSNNYEYQQRQDQRYNAGFLAHVDLNDYVKPYVNFGFMNDRTTEVVGPSGLFEDSNPYTPDNFYRVNCSNPLLSAQEQTVLGCTPAMVSADTADPGSVVVPVDIGRRNVEGGGRLSYYEHTNFRVVYGLQGDLFKGFTYNAYGQYYYTTLFNSNLNYLNFQSINNALLVTGTAAAPTCISGPPCVPYNIWNQGGLTAAQLAYLYSPGTAYGTNEEEIAHADFTGDLGEYHVESPWAHEAVGVNLGMEHRLEALSFAPDGEELSGNLAGFSGASVAINDSYDVNEGFFEVRAPLVQDLPLAHDLDLDVGYRYSDYSTAGPTNTYKFEVQYAPTASFRLRYSYDRAIRAPNLIELYNPQAYGQQSFLGVDPCAGAAPTASLAQCEHTGVTAAEYGTIPQCVSDQCGQVTGGNPALKPEEADTYSVGISLTPQGMQNFTASIDYFHIAMFGLIGTIPGNYLFEQCLLYGVAEDCSQVVRNRVTGALTGASVGSGGYILQTAINTGAALFSGIDVDANYRLPIGVGSLLFTLDGTWIEHDITTPYQGAQSFDCAGLFGVNCGNTVNPNWRHNLRVSWETPWDRLLLSAQWRFIGATTFDNNNANPALQYFEMGEYDSVNARIPNYSYFDLSASWPIWKDIEVRGGVNNIFDKDPPILDAGIAGVGTANTYPTYDELGRQIFVAFTAKY